MVLITYFLKHRGWGGGEACLYCLLNINADMRSALKVLRKQC